MKGILHQEGEVWYIKTKDKYNLHPDSLLKLNGYTLIDPYDFGIRVEFKIIEEDNKVFAKIEESFFIKND